MSGYLMIDCPECGLPVAYHLRGVLVGNRVLVGVTGEPESICQHGKDQHPSTTVAET